MASREYGILQRNISALKVQFLNFNKRLDGRYTRYELTQCRAYIAFCHAEVEIYLEATAARIVDAAERNWQQRGSVTKAIAAMLVYRCSKEINLPENPAEQTSQNKFESLIVKAIGIQRNIISNNHGIKPKNLSELFIPVGMKPEQFEDALLIQLDSFGKRRGDHVHQNSQVSLPKIRDPFDDELHDIEFLLAEIEPFDRIARQLR